jgi:Rha family phage regulatory protein
MNMLEFVMLEGKQPVTDTHIVAKHFDKDHRKVTRTVRMLIAKTGEWGVANFGHTPCVDEQNGETYSAYTMTKDGFMLLVMRFTGDKALQMQIAFVQAFDALAEHVRLRDYGIWSQIHDLEKRNAASFELASFGSRQMLRRKSELPVIFTKLEELKKLSQMPLFPELEDEDEKVA